MKVILLSALFAVTSAHADALPSAAHDETAEMQQAESALRAARTELVAARTRWDAAVAGDHPNPAGTWARRHFAAMQRVKVAERRWQAAKEQSDGSTVARR
jgi:hypothetical protein